MIKNKFLALFLVVALISSGCSAFAPKTQSFSVSTDQSDAKIFINGNLAGQGTANMLVKRNQNVAVMAQKDGFITAQRNIGKHLNTTGILDIVGGLIFLIPLFGLLAPGAYSLDETNVNLVLVQK